MTLLDVKNLSVKYGEKTIIRDISFSLDEGDWLMIAGPNGAGKSTLVNAVSGGVPFQGDVLCLEKDIREFRSGELARRMGVLAQNHYVGYSFTVEEVVRLGRYAYTKGVFGGRDENCEPSVDAALRLTGLEPFAKQSVMKLSGGELQRVFLAQLFAQDPDILMLDEPTNHLDLVYQKQLLKLVSEWVKRPGRAVISVVHDLSLARVFGTGVMLLRQGRIAAKGTADEVFIPDTLAAVYDMDVHGWMRDILSPWA